MPEIEVSAGPIEYADSGGDGPVLVFCHGVAMDGSVFDAVVDDLRADHRCIVPTLPLGAHRRAMHPDADLSLRGHGRIVAELLDRLDLQDVTLVGNDHAAALVVAGEHPERVGRLVISSCEAFENYPPGLPGKNLALTARVPGGLWLAMQAMRVRALRRLPVGLGWMTKRPIPHALTDPWFARPRTDPGVRRDLRTYAAGARRGGMDDVMERLRSFDRPALVLWAAEDRVMPVEHGRRLAALLPDARLVEIPDSRTLIPLDQPAEFARQVREFVASTRRTAVADSPV